MLATTLSLLLLCSLSTAQDTKLDGETMDGIASNCNAYHTVKSGDDCDTVAKEYGITRAQFLKWNTDVSSDCVDNFWVNYAYCVGVDTDASSASSVSSVASSAQSTLQTKTSTRSNSQTTPFQTTPKSSWASTVTKTPIFNTTTAFNSTRPATYSVNHPVTSWDITQPTPETAWPPQKTQAGQAEDCSDWHEVLPGETCASIAASYGSASMTKKEFIKWNPAVLDNCSGLFVGYYVCVDTRPTKSTISFASSSTLSLPTMRNMTTATPTVDYAFIPSPAASGMAENCQGYYQATGNDTCYAALRQSVITQEQFFTWNPSLDSKCGVLKKGYWYCIAAFADGYEFPMPSTVTSRPTSLPTSAAKTCKAWYQALAYDSCDRIVSVFDLFELDDFIKWNPSVGKDCSKGTTKGAWYCVVVEGSEATRTEEMVYRTGTVTSASATPSN